MMRQKLLKVTLILLLFAIIWQLAGMEPAAKAGDDMYFYACYLQTDSRWASHPYGRCSYKGVSKPATLGLDTPCNGTIYYYGSGCSVLSLVNSISALTERFADPTVIADFAVNNGYRGTGSIDPAGLYSNWCATYGSYYEVYYQGSTDSFNSTVQTHIKNGGVAILNVVGHFVACVDYSPSQDKYLVLDSAPTKNRRDNDTGGRIWLSAYELRNDWKFKTSGAYLLYTSRNRPTPVPTNPIDPTPVPTPPANLADCLILIDSPTSGGKYTSDITIKGWIASRYPVKYIMGQLDGVGQYDLTSSLTNDSGVKSYTDSTYGSGAYPYNKRFSATIPKSSLSNYKSYTFGVFASLSNGYQEPLGNHQVHFSTGKISGTGGGGGTVTPAPQTHEPYVLHMDMPSGSYAGNSNIEITGWISTDKTVAYAMAEVVGVKQYNLGTIADDPAVREANLNMYSSNKRFRGVLPISDLSSNTSYTCRTWVGFTDGTATEPYTTTFKVGTIAQTDPIMRPLVVEQDYAIKIDGPTGTHDGYHDLEVTGWIVSNQDINHLMVEWTNGSFGGQMNLTGSLRYAEDVYQNAIVQYGAGAFSRTQRFNGVIPLTSLQGDSDYTFKVWACFADGHYTNVETTSFHMDEIPTGIKAPKMGFDTPVANGTYSELLDVSGWIVSDSPVMYLQSQVDNSSGSMVREIQNVSYVADNGALQQFPTFKYSYRFTGQFRTDALAGGTYTIRAWCGDDEGVRTEISRNFKLADMSSLNTTDYYVHLDSPTEGTTYNHNFEIAGWIGAYAPITYALFQVDGAYQNSFGLERAADAEQWLQNNGYNYTYVRRFRGVIEPWRLSTSQTYTVRAWFGLGRTGMTDSNRAETTFRTASSITRDTYTVKYDANGGTGAPGDATKICGQDLTLSTTSPTRLGYTFKGWTDVKDAENIVKYLPGATYVENAPVTLYALWEPAAMITGDARLETEVVRIAIKQTYRFFSFTPKETARFRFETQGASSPQLAIYSAAGTLLKGASSSTGDCSLTVDLVANQPYYVCCAIHENTTTGSYTLVVRRGYPVILNANTGDGEEARSVYYQFEGEPLSLPDEIPLNYKTLTYDAAGGATLSDNVYVPAEFIGWADPNTEGLGDGDMYAPGDTYEANMPTELVAQWVYQRAGNLEEPVYTGKDFICWLDESGEIVDENYYVVTDETITAAYTDIVIPITSMRLLPSRLDLEVGDVVQLTINYQPADATLPQIYWTSSNPEAVTVSQSGVVTVVGPGASTITAVVADGSFAPTATIVAGDPVFTVIYDANGGSGAPAVSVVNYGDAYAIPATAPSREGYAFMGWADEADATAPIWQPGDALTVERTQTLYAVWTVESFAVVFDANGGANAPGPQVQIYSEPLTLTSETPTRDGYAFAGWALTADADTAIYAPGDIYQENRERTLYAVWKEIPTGVMLNYSQLTMYLNSSKQLRAFVQPAGAAGSAVVWSTSDNSIVSVSGGMVTALATGTATITCVVASDSSLTASCLVKVVAAAPSSGTVELPETEERGAVPGETVTASVRFNSSNAAFAKLVFNYDVTALEFISAQAAGTHVTIGSSIVMAVSNGKIPDGIQADLTFRVLESAGRGVYPIDVTVVECYTLDEEDCLDYAASADSIRAGCVTHVPERMIPTPATRETNGLGGSWVCELCGAELNEPYPIETGRCFWLPAGLQVIDDEAFANLTMQQVEIPYGAVRIGSGAFRNCSQLLVVIIPETVTEIADDAFEGCSNVCIFAPAGSTAATYAENAGVLSSAQ